ncbi:major facilitator superfamily domain-containing protein [Boletus reticuloceps]|uniref:Major facilitator superfamily domain-containing protein n=1 Tax=Boletus reticuloceps TaxID=495285 RepID=A0A8I2YMN8_9AGAM|nr:major facilitator superfamily domain-containing protein [Boletus reticuloceps]
MNTPNEKHENDTRTDLDFPDGGLTAWLTAFMIQVAGFGFVNAFCVFQDYYSQRYLTNVSSSAISWIGSTNSFLILSGGLFFGPFYDRGYFYWLVIGGSCLQIICLFMLSFTQPDHFYQVYFSIPWLGFGLATSMSYVPSLAVLSQHFEKRRAMVMSIVTSGAPIGAAGYTILLNNLFNGDVGFANSIRITAATNAVLLLIGCTLMRTRSLHPTTRMRYSQLLKSSSADYPYIFATIGCLLFGAGSFFPIFYIQLDSSMHRLGQEFSFYTNVILNAGNFIGRITAGAIAAYCGISNAIIGSTLGTAIVTFAMVSLSTRAGAANIGLFIGFFLGVYVALCAPLITRLTHDLSQLGARMGISLFMAGLGSLLGTPLAGALLGPDYSWWRPAVLCGCFSIASTLTFATTLVILQRQEKRDAHRSLDISTSL